MNLIKKYDVTGEKQYCLGTSRIQKWEDNNKAGLINSQRLVSKNYLR